MAQIFKLPQIVPRLEKNYYCELKINTHEIYFSLSPAFRAPIRRTRGQRIRDRPLAANANRRQYGKGMVGRLLNRTIKRKRLTSSVKKQIELLTDHR